MTISRAVLAIVAAPLHGARMPRKVLRPLAGRPLLLHGLPAAFGVAAPGSRVVVVTDDDEVALLAERNGCATVVDDRARLGEGQRFEALLSEVVDEEERRAGVGYDAVALVRPAAPLIAPVDLQQAVDLLLDGPYDTVISAREEREHAWMRVDGRYVPDFGRRAGEPSGPLYREIGAFLVSRRGVIAPDRFTGPQIGMAIVPPPRAIHITSPHEWWICERLIGRRHVVFVVAGHPLVGMGHIYRAQQIAHEITNHEVTFVCTRESELAERTIAGNGYAVARQKDEPLEETVIALAPDLVVNDFLDTSARYVAALRRAGAKVVNFEDLGDGAEAADLVVNELYLESSPRSNHRTGPEFFCIREEFLQATPKPFGERVEDVMITFGGTDSADLTARTLRAIWPEAERRGIRISLVTGMGYEHAHSLDAAVRALDSPLIVRANGTKRMSEFMARADLAFSSSGRTLFELATLRVPAIVLACNEREETHPFARAHQGFAYLGRHDRVSDAQLRDTFVDLVDRPEPRRAMRDTLSGCDFGQGKMRVLAEIAAVLGTPLN
ncbi:MAG TPA: hypothetical protein VFY79_12410 [Dehalococcoidia bacterium]|nr:hypothetical protein [Dehalococcoidia bacterium]